MKAELMLGTSVGTVRASSLPAYDTSAFLRQTRGKMAAEQGDINALYSILSEDRCLLEHMEQASFLDTPLHITASKGKTPFALEVMRLMPSLAGKPNQDGFSPILLALQNKHFQTVRGLIDMDRDLRASKEEQVKLLCIM
ncbi:hypothetical protein GH714_034187 [Hevea brasiliensis]|uniref:Uncharacterized protein n=1 Tax=Hevea brasiliensis TaxID=3981 RepID=A0A6A6KA30_HEVBR|nr:hypothetical protein GH714_034187 [Hevea brasiliensis]